MDEKIDVIAGVLIRCFFMGIACLTVWLVSVMTMSDWAYEVHSKFFPLTREQFALVHYTGLLITKVGIFGLFLLPWIGIKLVQKKRK